MIVTLCPGCGFDFNTIYEDQSDEGKIQFYNNVNRHLVKCKKYKENDVTYMEHIILMKKSLEADMNTKQNIEC